ncbi:MAG: hypothetical protein LBG43_02405 [Treponema sp.]|nr:hypothetical protein [Treponema sp.]
MGISTKTDEADACQKAKSFALSELTASIEAHIPAAVQNFKSEVSAGGDTGTNGEFSADTAALANQMIKMPHVYGSVLNKGKTTCLIVYADKRQFQQDISDLLSQTFYPAEKINFFALRDAFLRCESKARLRVRVSLLLLRGNDSMRRNLFVIGIIGMPVITGFSACDNEFTGGGDKPKCTPQPVLRKEQGGCFSGPQLSPSGLCTAQASPNCGPCGTCAVALRFSDGLGRTGRPVNSRQKRILRPRLLSSFIIAGAKHADFLPATPPSRMFARRASMNNAG